MQWLLQSTDESVALRLERMSARRPPGDGRTVELRRRGCWIAACITALPDEPIRREDCRNQAMPMSKHVPIDLPCVVEDVGRAMLHRLCANGALAAPVAE